MKSHFVFKLYLFSCLSILKVNANLQVCPENATKTFICSKNVDHSPFRYVKCKEKDLQFIIHSNYRVPRPVPRNISCIVDIKDILEVNEDQKTITIYLYLIMEWIDPHLKVVGPSGKK